jgi:hypothetical protein
MTPEQYAYYQQPQQQEEGGLLDFLGKAALAAGAVAGGIAGTRYLRGRMAQQAPPREAKRPGAPNYEAVRRAAATQMPENPRVTRSQTPPSPGSTADRVRRMEQITREARAERMPGVIQTDLASLVAQTGAPSPSLSAVPVSATPVRPVTGPIVTDLSRLQGQATELPSTYYSRQPGSFADITSAQREITGVNAAERLSQDPELLSLVRQQKAEELSEARSMQAKAQAEYRNLIRDTAEEKVLEPLRATPKNFLQERLEQSGYVPTQVEKQQSTAAVISDQSVNAVYSAEDQQTGRVKQQLQRNEDVDLSRVDFLEDMAEGEAAQEADRRAMMENPNLSEMIGYEADAPINQVASQLSDGLPVDQAESTAGAFAKKQIMQTRMGQMRAQLAQEGYRGLALEKELASRTNVKQAAELYAATGDPNVLQLANEAPSLPLTVEPKTNLQLGQSKTSFVGEEIPTSSYYEPFKQREAESGGLVHADIYYTNKLSNLGAKLEGAPEYIDNPEYTNFIEQTNMAMSAMRQGDSTAAKVFARNKALLNAGKAPVAKIENPEYQMLQRQVGYAEQSRADVRNKQEALELQAQRFPMLQKVTQTGEGPRLFAEVDPSTGQLISETIELRSGRPAVPGGTVSSTATGRAIRGRVGAEGTVAGPTPGIFEPGAIATESTFKPESARYRGETLQGAYEAADAGKGLQYEAQPVRWDPNLHLPEQRTPEGFVYTEETMLKPSQPIGREQNLGPIKSPYSVAKPSVDVSSTLRQLQLRGKPGEADAFLTRFKQGLI